MKSYFPKLAVFDPPSRRWSVLSLLAIGLFMGGCIQKLPVGALNPKDDSSQAPEPDSETSENDKASPETNPGQDPSSSAPSSTDSQSASKPEKIACEIPETRACDQVQCSCLSLTLGIGCKSNGSEQSRPELSTHTNYTQSQLALSKQELPASFAPTEGNRAVLLSTGRIEDFSQRPYELRDSGRCDLSRPDFDKFVHHYPCPSRDVPDPIKGHVLPAPMSLLAVDPSGQKTCIDDPSLVGQGDCSNSMQSLVDARHCWNSADPSTCRPEAVHDASAFSIKLTVPRGIRSLSFDFAFLSAEYPFAYQHPSRYATDAFVVWLKSEQWTGNVVMDDKGHPMTIENQWLVLKDQVNLAKDCPAPCNEHKLHNFAMQGHAATPWLTTEFPVQGGERIMLTFAVMEFGSPLLDSFALIDNLRWGCNGSLKGPVTRKAE